jgi:hypothetical protein
MGRELSEKSANLLIILSNIAQFPEKQTTSLRKRFGISLVKSYQGNMVILRYFFSGAVCLFLQGTACMKTL